MPLRFDDDLQPHMQADLVRVDARDAETGSTVPCEVTTDTLKHVFGVSFADHLNTSTLARAVILNREALQRGWSDKHDRSRGLAPVTLTRDDFPDEARQQLARRRGKRLKIVIS